MTSVEEMLLFCALLCYIFALEKFIKVMCIE